VSGPNRFSGKQTVAREDDAPLLPTNRLALVDTVPGRRAQLSFFDSDLETHMPLLPSETQKVPANPLWSGQGPSQASEQTPELCPSEYSNW